MPRASIYGTADTTLREIVHISIGGPQVRVVFTNEFGTEPLTIGAAHVAVSQGGSTINLVSAAGLTFAGRTTVTIPPGASSGAKLRLKGHGIERASEKGDQYVVVKVMVPKGLDEEDKAAVETIAKKHPIDARADVGW